MSETPDKLAERLLDDLASMGVVIENKPPTPRCAARAAAHVEKFISDLLAVQLTTLVQRNAASVCLTLFHLFKQKRPENIPAEVWEIIALIAGGVGPLDRLRKPPEAFCITQSVLQLVTEPRWKFLKEMAQLLADRVAESGVEWRIEAFEIGEMSARLVASHKDGPELLPDLPPLEPQR